MLSRISREISVFIVDHHKQRDFQKGIYIINIATFDRTAVKETMKFK